MSVASGLTGLKPQSRGAGAAAKFEAKGKLSESQLARNMSDWETVIVLALLLTMFYIDGPR